MRHAIFGVAVLLLGTGCGARSELTEPSSSVADAFVADAGVPETLPTCNAADLSTWRIERFRNDDDYERTAVATSGVPWVALKVKDGNIILARLDIDPTKGIVFEERIELSNTPVYPIALDVDDVRFVLVTTSGINWNGDVAIWRVDRKSGTVTHVAVGAPTDPTLTATSALGLVGDAIALAFARVADNQGTIELRNDQLEVVQTLVTPTASFTAVKTVTGVDIYAGTATRVHADGSSLTQTAIDPTWQVIGGLSGSLVEIGNQIRLTNGAEAWSAAWPDTQISPPAIVRTDGTRVAFSLEGELSPVVGHLTDAGLVWLPIASTPDAPGYGLGLLPVVNQHRLGVIYLGLEVPKPEQPLRYFGLVCE